MPVRSLNSSVFKWPDRDQVARLLRKWAEKEIPKHRELVRLGYFGSYASGNWGVGSDLDLLAVVRKASEPFEKRSLLWSLDGLPVPAEILVYTIDEWQEMKEKGYKFAAVVEKEVVWMYSSNRTMSIQIPPDAASG